jgi:hypothetical protein
LAKIIDILFLLILSIGIIVVKLLFLNGNIYSDISNNKVLLQFFDITIMSILIILLVIGCIVKYKSNSNKSKLFIFSIISIIAIYSMNGCFDTYDNKKLLIWWLLFAFLFTVSLLYLINYYASIKIEDIENYNKRQYFPFILSYAFYYIIVDILYPIISLNEGKINYVSIVNEFIFMMPLFYVTIFYIKPIFTESVKMNVIISNFILTLVSINGLIILSQFIFQILCNTNIDILNICIMLLYIIFAVISLWLNIKLYKRYL